MTCKNSCYKHSKKIVLFVRNNTILFSHISSIKLHRLDLTRRKLLVYTRKNPLFVLSCSSLFNSHLPIETAYEIREIRETESNSSNSLDMKVGFVTWAKHQYAKLLFHFVHSCTVRDFKPHEKWG